MTRAVGAQAEQIASQYLQQRGLKLLTQNYHSRRGEIDLIMRDKNTLVFVEVRARKSATHGSALESVTQQKKSRLIAAAQAYLQHTALDLPCRFDVIAINLSDTASPRIPTVAHWIQDAFQV